MKLEHVLSMAHSPVRNYAIPGLTSWLIGGKAPNGSLVRLFHSSREHEEPITPHTHRFNFVAHVLQGTVRNVLWYENNDNPDKNQDHWMVSREKYMGEMGKYEVVPHRAAYFYRVEHRYHEGDQYEMDHKEFHSIYFGRDTYVLMFEGPQMTDTSEILEPCVDGARVPTFKVEPWMFQKIPQQ